MTRNLYQGADLAPVITATTVAELLAKSAQVFGTVQSTDFPARAKVLAKEIRGADPLLIGLQEVALWRKGAPGVLDGPVTPATIVVYDFLQILQDELVALGLHYSVVIAQATFDGEVPTALGFDVRLTQRNAILAKSGLSADELTLANATSAHFVTNIVFPTLLGPVTDTRGWTAVDVSLKKRSFRFINTHLDSFSPLIRLAQSNELLAGPVDGTPLPVVLVGDLNAIPGEAAHANLIGSGLEDAWVEANRLDPGFTFGFSENLLDPAPAFTQRIDYVLASAGVKIGKVHTVGLDAKNRTPAGLWPSDHAGIVANLKP
jgi:hypothetical protein